MKKKIWCWIRSIKQVYEEEDGGHKIIAEIEFDEEEGKKLHLGQGEFKQIKE